VGAAPAGARGPSREGRDESTEDLETMDVATGLLSRARRMLPEGPKALLRRFLVRKVAPYDEHELGVYVLQRAEEFCKGRGGHPEALQAVRLRKSILRQRHLEHTSEAHQYLQTAFMPDYEQSLFEYYQQQQFLMLLAFLGYPFRGPGCLCSHVDPFLVASSRLPGIRALDYGAGIPYGLIHLLRTCPEKIESITIVDLDLVHTELSEYILSQLAPDKEITFLRITDAESVPDLGGRAFNLIYGKDIFEHVHDPERLLRVMLDRAAPSCLAYFDIRDHGAKYLQHVHPQLSHLSRVVCERSFKSDGQVGGLSEFVRNA